VKQLSRNNMWPKFLSPSFFEELTEEDTIYMYFQQDSTEAHTAEIQCDAMSWFWWTDSQRVEDFSRHVPQIWMYVMYTFVGKLETESIQKQYMHFESLPEWNMEFYPRKK
jgi:hypothetical protein